MSLYCSQRWFVVINHISDVLRLEEYFPSDILNNYSLFETQDMRRHKIIEDNMGEGEKEAK